MPYLDSTEMALASAKNDVEYEIGPLVRLGSRPNNIMDKVTTVLCVYEIEGFHRS